MFGGSSRQFARFEEIRDGRSSSEPALLPTIRSSLPKNRSRTSDGRLAPVMRVSLAFAIRRFSLTRRRRRIFQRLSSGNRRGERERSHSRLPTSIGRNNSPLFAFLFFFFPFFPTYLFFTRARNARLLARARIVVRAPVTSTPGKRASRAARFGGGYERQKLRHWKPAPRAVAVSRVPSDAHGGTSPRYNSLVKRSPSLPPHYTFAY